MPKSPPQYTKFLHPVNTPITRPLDNPKKAPWQFAVDQNIQPGSLNYSHFDQNSKIYRAVVSLARAKGAFQSVQEAVNNVNSQGGGIVYIKNGQYNQSNNLTLSQNIAIVGESRDGVILDFGANDFGIIAAGDTGDYNTGTIAVTNNSKTVTGSGTSWLGNVDTTKSLVIDGVIYSIASVDSNTQITLTYAYQGESYSSLSYFTAKFISNIQLANFTVQNTSGNTTKGMIQWTYIRDSFINNVKSQNFVAGIDGKGFYLQRCVNDRIDGCIAFNNVGMGIYLDSGQSCIVQNSYSYNNQLNGIEFDNALGLGTKNFVKDSTSAHNGQYGIYLRGGKNLTQRNIIYRNGLSGIYVIGTGENLITDNLVEQNGGNGIRIDVDGSTYNTIVGNYISFNGLSSIQINSNNTHHNVITGNHLREGNTTTFSIIAASGSYAQINTTRGNFGGAAAEGDRSYIMAKNVSGSTISAGSLVVLDKTASTGYQVTTTTTVGDNTVFGMAAESITNNNIGAIQVSGYTSLLKVNGTTAISAGNFICCYSAAGIGQKAGTGNTIIAMAFTGYSVADSSGVIEALILPPRNI